MSLDDFVPQLSRPATVEQLAKALGVATQIFSFIADNTDPERIYRRHLIPKRASRKLPAVPVANTDGFIEISLDSFDLTRFRLVWEAYNPVIRHAHKSAARVLWRYLSRPGSSFPHDAAFGYIKGRSTRDNAKRHLSAKYLLSADIQDFFPTITAARVELALNSAGLNPNVTHALARFLTIDGSLPLGLNASPMIANLVATPLDLDLSALSEEYDCIYTRYADDITFSGADRVPPRQAIELALKRHFFRLNKAKFRTSKRGQKHYVTGLSVADKATPHTPREMKRRVRQELYYINKFGFHDHLSRTNMGRTDQHHINRLEGTVNYIASIEPRHARKLRLDWASACEQNDLSRSFEPRPVIHLRRASWFVDEAEIVHPDGTRLLALCLVEILEPAQLDMELASLFAHEAGDAFGAADSRSISSKGLHWADATWTQRETIVRLLATAPVRAFVAMARVPEHQYAETYTRLLRRILETTLRTADDATVEIHVEENRSKISEPQVQQAVRSAYSSLEVGNYRRPLNAPTVRVISKGDSPSCCVPDVLLGVLHRYACSRAGKDEAALPVRLFELLRNRYSVIFDEHSGKIYHHRLPFKRW